jgi:lycopene cyclase domain-containing protein
MKEYLIINIFFIVVISFLDRVLKTNLYKNPKFWIFQTIIILLTTIVDNYSSSKPIVIFNDKILLNIRVLAVPVENYFFGFNLLTLNLILFEFFQRRKGVD